MATNSGNPDSKKINSDINENVPDPKNIKSAETNSETKKVVSC